MWNPRSTVVAVLIATSSLTSCSSSSEALGEASGDAAHVTPVAGTDLGRVTLTREASERLGIMTAPVRASVGDPARKARSTSAVRTVVPAAAVLYDAQGHTWAYVDLGHLTFVRAAITVDHVEGNRAYLIDGPVPSTTVVTVGAPELLGVELGVEGE